jgi:hypothetical protein
MKIGDMAVVNADGVGQNVEPRFDVIIQVPPLGTPKLKDYPDGWDWPYSTLLNPLGPQVEDDLIPPCYESL